MRFVGVLVGTIIFAALVLVPAPGAEAAGRSNAPTTAPTTAPLASESPALRSVLDHAVGADPAAEFHLSAALAALGQDPAASALRRYLLHAYLRQAAGEPLAPAIPARQAIAASVALLPVDQDAQAATRWSTALNRQLSIVWPQAPLPLPPELEAREKSYTELGPGLWADRFSDGRPRGLVWLSSWRNQHTVPLAMGDFKPKLSGPGAPPTHFECTLPRYAKPLALGPGTDTSFLCRTSDTPDPAHPAYVVVVRRLTGKEPATVEINALDLVGQTATQGMVNRLEAQAKPKLDAFLAQNADCSRLGNCAPEAKGKSTGPQAGNSAKLWDSAHPAWRTAKIAVQCIALLLLYAAGVRVLGEGWTASLLVLFGWIGTAKMLIDSGWQGELFFTSGSYLGSPGAFFIPIFLIALAVLAPLFAVGMLKIVHELIFGDRAMVLRETWNMVVRSAVEWALERAFGRRRRR